MFAFFGAVVFSFNMIYALKEWDGKTYGPFILYHTSLIKIPVYNLWCRFAVIIEGYSVWLFYALLDIVPIMVYYHGSELTQAVNIELENMNNFDYKNSIRFENLRVLLQRADELFGSLMLL